MRKLFIIIVCALLAATLSGCTGALKASYREISELRLVRTVGFDSLDNGELVSVCADAATEDGESIRLSAEGSSLLTAMQALRQRAESSDLYYPHISYMLMGEDAAEHAAVYLDFIERSAQARLDAPLLVVRGSGAEALVTEAGSGGLDITDILASMEREGEREGGFTLFTCGETARSLAEYGAALCSAVRPERAKEGITAVRAGYAVLRDGALAGWLDESAGRGVTLLMGRSGGGAVYLGGATAELTGADVNYEPVWSAEGKLIGARVDIALRAVLTETDGHLDPDDAAVMAGLESALARTAGGWAKTVLDTSQELEADFMALGKKLELAAPFKWQAASIDWEAAFAQLPITVSVSANIERTGALGASADRTGETA